MKPREDQFKPMRGERILRWLFSEKVLPAPPDADPWFLPVRAEMNQRLLRRKIEFRTLYFAAFLVAVVFGFVAASDLSHSGHNAAAAARKVTLANDVVLRADRKIAQMCGIVTTLDAQMEASARDRSVLDKADAARYALDLASVRHDSEAIRKLRHLGC